MIIQPVKIDLEFDGQPKFKKVIEMFRWIWDNRPHVSELTGERLLPYGHPKWHWQFLHVLGKQAYPAYKLNANNILLGLPDEHENQTDYEVFNEKVEELKREYYQVVYGKSFD